MTAIKTAEIEDIAGQLLYDGNMWILLAHDGVVITTSAAQVEQRLQDIVDYAVRRNSSNRIPEESGEDLEDIL